MKNVTCCHQSEPDTSSEREVLFGGQKVFLRHLQDETARYSMGILKNTSSTTSPSARSARNRRKQPVMSELDIFEAWPRFWKG